MQILEEVAITQQSLLRAEVDKGSAATTMGCGLGGPKSKFNYVLCRRLWALLLGGTYFGRGRKGSRLIFRPKDGDFSGNACEVEDVRRNPGTSYLFVLTAYPGSPLGVTLFHSLAHVARLCHLCSGESPGMSLPRERG